MTQFPETENTQDPVPETGKKKAGRPPGAKNKNKKPVQAAAGHRRRHMHNVSIQERIREGCHPDLVFDYYSTILKGQTPIWIEEDGECYVIPDPNPLLPAPTLTERNAAMRALIERGYGLPSQSITVDAEFRNKIEIQLTGINQQDLLAMDASKLFKIAEMFKIQAPTDVIDAEIVESTNELPETTGQ